MSELPTLLSSAAFEGLFPFLLAVDDELRLRRWGPALGRVLPTLAVGDALAEGFELVRPRLPELSFSELSARAKSVFMLRARARPKLLLRGQIASDADAGLAAFLVSPWVTEAEELSALGLSFSDFAVHDPLADMLVLLRAQQGSLEEAEALAARLRTQRNELERTTAQLEDKLAEIEAQRGLIRELSTPVIRVWEGVVLVPLVGILDEERGERLMSAVLDAVGQHRVRQVLIDLTGVAQFDAGIVRYLQRSAGALRLVGAGCALVGISPELARAMADAELGEGLRSYRSVEDGLRGVMGASLAMDDSVSS